MVVFVYILKCSDNRFYTGITNNLQRRLSEHNSGRCSFTSRRLPVTVFYTHEMPNYKHARWLEKKIKKTGAKKYLIFNQLENSYKNILNIL